MIICGCATVLACTVALAEPVGTAFTYQGQLKEEGVPITGMADLGFALWDAETGGREIDFLALESVEVNDGLFTVELDFGTEAFTGAARWLEIDVAFPSGVGRRTLLTPRQRLTPAPYALYALSGPAGGGDSLWTLTGNDIHNNNDGKVGIGTSEPSFTLEVRRKGVGTFGPATLGLHWEQAAIGESLHDWFYFAVGGSGFTTTTGTRMIRESGTDLHFQVQDEMNSGLPSTQMVLTDNGRLGIGTDTPFSPLHLSSTEGISLIIEADTDNSGEDDNARVQFKQDGGQVTGRVGYRHNSNALEVMQEYGSSLILGANNIDAITINNEGKVGIGIADAGSRLVVRENSTESVANFYQLGTGQGVRISMISAANPNPALTVMNMNDNVPALEVGGTASVDVLQVTGADVAEKFPVSESVEPGMVVAIDPDHPGQLRLSRAAYDHRVAGVVSGANGLPAGTILGHLPGHEDAPPIALTGRVWVRCDATSGPIEPGDFLTTSDTPGHAMRVNDRSMAQGAIIGKAMTSLERGRGLVLVLVGLQ
jgi:hypothetical protein